VDSFPNQFIDEASTKVYSQEKRCLGPGYEGIAQEVFFFEDNGVNCPVDKPSSNKCIVRRLREGENDNETKNYDSILP